MRLRRIDHIGVVVGDMAAHGEQLAAMGLTLGRSSPASSGGVQYQFLVRAEDA